MERQTVILSGPWQRGTAHGYVDAAPVGHVVEIRPPKRSDPQNRRMWAMLRDISQQVDWYGQKLTDDEWKDVLSAALKKQRAVPGIDGGFVILGQRTSKMTKAEMSELQTLMEAFGADKGVTFREEAT